MKLDPIALAVVQNRLDHIASRWARSCCGPRAARSSTRPRFLLLHHRRARPPRQPGRRHPDPHRRRRLRGEGAARGVRRTTSHEDDVFILERPLRGRRQPSPRLGHRRPVFCRRHSSSPSCAIGRTSRTSAAARPGPTIPSATEIFHEGIRLPPMRLDRERARCATTSGSCCCSISRTPHLLDGDLHAMLGSTRIGAEQDRAGS